MFLTEAANSKRSPWGKKRGAKLGCCEGKRGLSACADTWHFSSSRCLKWSSTVTWA